MYIVKDILYKYLPQTVRSLTAVCGQYDENRWKILETIPIPAGKP